MVPAEGAEVSVYSTPRLSARGMRIPAAFFANWFKMCGRSFPWRKEVASPFGILLAEVLLKQTRAEMVATVWPTLSRQYPNAASLESASEQVLYQHISCLGFGRQRARALRQLSAAINQAGGLPTQPTDLMKLPHVGIYSAHAVACFAFGQRVPVVDLSIVRFLSRLAGINPPSDIRESSGDLGDCTDPFARQGGQGAQLRPAGLRRGHLQGEVTSMRRVSASSQLRS